MRLTDIIHTLGDGLYFGRRITALTGSTFILDSIVITNGGSGYTSPPAVSFTGGGGGSGAAATAVLLNGAVTRIDITNPGSGYTTAPGVVIAAPSDGVTATANSVLAAGSLDSVVTAGRSVTPDLIVPIFLSPTWNLYHLRAGTDAENSPLIIRPDDYNGGTNAKVWELITVAGFDAGGTALKQGGKIFEHYADVGNVTTGETDLYSDTLPANQFTAPGDQIVAIYSGTIVNHATATRQIRAYLGGNLIADTTAFTVTAGSYWELRITMQRDGANNVRATAAFYVYSASIGNYVLVSTVTGLTFTAAMILKITGQAGAAGAATNDIVAKHSSLFSYPGL